MDSPNGKKKLEPIPMVSQPPPIIIMPNWWYHQLPPAAYSNINPYQPLLPQNTEIQVNTETPKPKNKQGIKQKVDACVKIQRAFRKHLKNSRNPVDDTCKSILDSCIKESIIDVLSELFVVNYSPLAKSNEIKEWRIWKELIDGQIFELCTLVLQELNPDKSSIDEIVDETIQMMLKGIEVAYENATRLIHSRVELEVLDLILKDLVKSEKIVENCLIEMQADEGEALLTEEQVYYHLFRIVIECCQEMKIKAYRHRPRRYKSNVINNIMHQTFLDLCVEEIAWLLQELDTRDSPDFFASMLASELSAMIIN